MLLEFLRKATVFFINSFIIYYSIDSEVIN